MKYLIYRAEEDGSANITKVEPLDLIGVEFGDNIDEAFSRIQEVIKADMTLDDKYKDCMFAAYPPEEAGQLEDGRMQYLITGVIATAVKDKDLVTHYLIDETLGDE